MSEPTRRDFLQGLAALGVVVFVPGCESDPPPTPTDGGAMDTGVPEDVGEMLPPVDPDPRPWSQFMHGVASGDPTPDAVILWTRITPNPAMPAPASLEVTWEVASDVAFTAMAGRGMFTTRADRDWTVKVDATGLMPGRTYYYRFQVQGVTSPVGRTRTAPSGATERLRFGVVSCASLAHGFFHAYRALAGRLDLDAIIHLGDYIYEYASGRYGLIRGYEPANECITLADYRARYAQYHKQAELRAVHQQFPFILVWDDHEFADNSYPDGAENHDPLTEGSWADRKRAAMQAYAEWLPIREQPDGRIYRKLPFGDLVDLVMLDTRIWGRQRQVSGPDAGSLDPNRQLLGADQESWFFDQVRTSTARWKLVGQQVMMGQLYAFGNNDQWDGYPAARSRFFNLVRGMSVHNVVVLTGDIHSSWAMDLTENPMDTTAYDRATGRGSLGVEFVCPAITSPGFPQQVASLADTFVRNAPHLKWADLTKRGYMVLDVTAARLQCAWYLYDDITVRAPQTERFTAAFSTADRGDHLTRDAEAAAPPTSVPAGAPPERA